MMPASTSAKDCSTIRATKGAAVMVRGTHAATMPSEVPTMRRVNGVIATIKMTKGKARRMLMTQPKMKLTVALGRIPLGVVALNHTPTGRPMT